MKTEDPLSIPARIAIAALAVLGQVGGWLILISGGFSHSPKYSREVTRVEGAPAWVMAAIFFIMGTIAIAVLLQAGKASRKWYWVACGAALLAPVVYQMTQSS